MDKMNKQIGTEYYVNNKSKLLERLNEEMQRCRPIISDQFGNNFANVILKEIREEFEALIPQIPYIGGDENHLTNSLIGSVICLALYKVMKKHSKTAEETGKVLYDAILSRIGEPKESIPPSKMLTLKQLMERRKKRAERSLERYYPDDYVYEFVEGDGKELDYGYNFMECATQKFYHAQDADEFTPFYCFLDFPKSRVYGLGLTRTMTLTEGHKICNHRFKKGRSTELVWPPPFLRKE
jgi:hypothetical protein